MPTSTPSDRSIQPRSAVITMFGAFVVSMGNWIAVADLVKLLGQMGLEGPSVRAAVARLKKAGLLDSDTRDGAAGYSASAELLAVLDEGDTRIFTSQVPADLADGWVVAVFSVPESQRARRHRLRAQLGSLGFGPFASGVWMAPRRAKADAERLLVRSGLDSYVHLFTADYAGFESVASLTGALWGAEDLVAEYQDFANRHRSVVGNWTSAGAGDLEAFVVCMKVLEHWRPLTYRDPGLPDELQPGAATRTLARDLFADIGARLKPAADNYVQAQIG